MAPHKLRQRNVGASNDEPFKTNLDGDDDNNKRKAGKSVDPVDRGLVKVSTSSSSFALWWKRFLQSYTVYVGKSLNQDKLIKTLQYSLWMLSRFYYGKDDKVARAALAKLCGELSWARYVTRLFGLPTALEGVQSGSWATPKALGKAMAWSMVFYYPLENLAYLKFQAPQWIQAPRFGARVDDGKPDRLAVRASAWSCRFWLAYTVLDIVRSTLALQPNLVSKDTAALAPIPSDTRRNERLQIIRNALFVMPAIHWSLPNWDTQPLLSETVCNTLLWLEAVVCMYQSYHNTPPVQ